MDWCPRTTSTLVCAAGGTGGQTRLNPLRDLSVVIVNYHTADLTSACVASVEATGADLLREVVIVDNASGEAAQLRHRHPSATVIESDANRGFAAGVNRGVAETSAPFVVVLNPDTQAAPGALAALRQRLLESPRLGVAGPVLTDEAGGVRLDTYRRLPSLWSLFTGAFFPLGRLLMGTRFHPELRSRARAADGGPVARVCGSAMAIRREAWDAVGPLDERYFLYFEEIDWQERLSRAGWGIEIVPDARVMHAIQGGAVRETWPRPYLDSAFLYFEQRGRSRRVTATVLLAGFALSRAVLRIAALVPGQRDKARRMLGGYRELARAARAASPYAAGSEATRDEA